MVPAYRYVANEYVDTSDEEEMDRRRAGDIPINPLEARIITGPAISSNPLAQVSGEIRHARVIGEPANAEPARVIPGGRHEVNARRQDRQQQVRDDALHRSMLS